MGLISRVSSRTYRNVKLPKIVAECRLRDDSIIIMNSFKFCIVLLILIITTFLFLNVPSQPFKIFFQRLESNLHTRQYDSNSNLKVFEDLTSELQEGDVDVETTHNYWLRTQKNKAKSSNLCPYEIKNILNYKPQLISGKSKTGEVVMMHYVIAAGKQCPDKKCFGVIKRTLWKKYGHASLKEKITVECKSDKSS